MEPGAAGLGADMVPRGPAMHWIGPPTGMDANATHYRTAQVNAQHITIGKNPSASHTISSASHLNFLPLFLSVCPGDFVYLQPAEPEVPLYIARIEDLVHLHPEAPPTDPAAAAPAVPPTPQMAAAVSWYYRPHEISDLDHAIYVYDNEVFASDEVAQHDLASVAGRCAVVPPGSSSLRMRAAGGEVDTYVCSRKYVPDEG
jgi:hypothetical protein